MKNLSVFLLAFIVSVLIVNTAKKSQKLISVKVPSVKVEKSISNDEGYGSCSANGHKKDLNCFAYSDGHIEEPQLKDSKNQESSPVTSLTILSKPRAIYTDEARSNSTEGTVKLRVIFNANETVGSISVIEGLPNGLTEQAIEAARQMKFKAATDKNRKPLTVIKTVQYNFTLY